MGRTQAIRAARRRLAIAGLAQPRRRLPGRSRAARQAGAGDPASAPQAVAANRAESQAGTSRPASAGPVSAAEALARRQMPLVDPDQAQRQPFRHGPFLSPSDSSYPFPAHAAKVVGERARAAGERFGTISPRADA
ncbi:hypothetical protein CV_3156 [Chromobacterium violaceum ATCC 12472]|uniref:Uncharacterized protein n=1 Tax=Chromobacterium violaceum (strain ATCC 12472 / DSM 30191 / JCM 1249 / CCUG 213 / NBRC 12614 / NCIMB 9131 / NCTC 9757 / MK) TaxID=243365 RepID=Q7NTA3_CHRVO|nr:hypothetical protein CV_3156 [Chromobacterium violaceum ATCC 12472]